VAEDAPDRPGMSASGQSSTPPANVYEGNGQISVVIPVPGAHPAQMQITMAPDRLLLQADCKYAQDSQHYLRRDWTVGQWRLDLVLPKHVDPARTRATLNLGVLVVMAPLSDAGEGEHQVRITEH